MGKEEFGKVKKLVLDYVNGCLERKKDVPLCIFNVACAGRE